MLVKMTDTKTAAAATWVEDSMRESKLTKKIRLYVSTISQYHLR